MAQSLRVNKITGNEEPELNKLGEPQGKAQTLKLPLSSRGVLFPNCPTESSTALQAPLLEMGTVKIEHSIMCRSKLLQIGQLFRAAS